ncbi:MAG: hypothetical protein COB14_09055 [Alphaproteobacteria bacterium]|nr:MAG: hypothetical protein COB14_09055 [Alphaproteobacteria bacterium]
MNDLISKLSQNAPFILLFHGVINENNYEVRNCIRKHIEKDYFSNILNTLKEGGTALSMDDVVEIHGNGDVYPPNSFIVTFDDGFENNYSVAAPILSDLNIPSTFYITTDFIENGTMSWTDRIEYCLENVKTGSVTLPWESDNLSFCNSSGKIELMQRIRQRVFHDKTINVDDFTDWFYKQFDMDVIQTTSDPLDKKLSWQQVQEMHEDDLFTIGGHTHTHIVMSFSPQAEMEQEIDLNLKLLKEKSNVDTVHFAYPQGQANHYNISVINALKKRGIACCPTAIDGKNTRETGLFDLYRTMIV